MSKEEYKIKTDNITNITEEMSMISAVSYEIENKNNNSLHSKMLIINYFI